MKKINTNRKYIHNNLRTNRMPLKYKGVRIFYLSINGYNFGMSFIIYKKILSICHNHNNIFIIFSIHLLNN